MSLLPATLIGVAGSEGLISLTSAIFLEGGQDLVLEILMRVVKGKGHISLHNRKSLHSSASCQLYGFVQVTRPP